LRGNGNDEIDESGGDDAKGHDSGHIGHRSVDASASDLGGVTVTAEDGREDDQEQNR
jgi:hypothetical protein